MKILLVHQYYNTPETGGPLRSFYLARGLSLHGHEVHVITSNAGKSTQPIETEYTVHYLPVYYDNHLGFVSRLMAFTRFAWLAYNKALTIDGIDLCYAISTPLTVGWVARKLKSVRNIPYVFEVGDLWPEAPVQMGVLKTRLLIKAARRFEKGIYDNAEGLVALSPGIKNGILKSTTLSKVTVIPNMSDCRYYQLEPKDARLQSKFGVSKKLVVTYFGAAGRANHLEYLVEAAKYAKHTNSRLHFLIVAYGSELSRIKKLARSYELNNLDFLEYRNRDALRQVLNVTDVVYVSYADIPVLATGSPNKFFDGLAAGKLMVVNFKGWLKHIAEQHHFGYYVDPEKPEMLTELLTPLEQNREELLKYQNNARLIAETFFSRGLAVQKLLKFLSREDQPAVTEPEVYTLTA